MLHVIEMMKKGGAWLGAARDWLQRKKLNGSAVTWGSQDLLQPPMTVRDVEDVALRAAAAERDRVLQVVDRHWDLGKDEILKRIREG